MSSSCPEALLREFEGLRVFTDPKGRRAPHKPLLILLALARLQAGDSADITFEEIQEPLARLLELYGPPVARVKPHYPFWFLKFDSIWVVRDEDQFVVGADRAPSMKSLLEFGRAGLRDEVRDQLATDPRCLIDVAQLLLDAHFPESLQDEIASEVGLDLNLVRAKRPRDPRFRPNVLRAYGAECAICGFQVHFKRSTFGIDAAHIRWHAHGGRDELSNGLALCALHHRAFDTGIVGIRDDLRIMVSQHLQGGTSAREWLLPFAGQELHRPHSSDQEPSQESIAWHQQYVFQGPPTSGS